MPITWFHVCLISLMMPCVLALNLTPMLHKLSRNTTGMNRTCLVSDWYELNLDLWTDVKLQVQPWLHYSSQWSAALHNNIRVHGVSNPNKCLHANWLLKITSQSDDQASNGESKLVKPHAEGPSRNNFWSAYCKTFILLHSIGCRIDLIYCLILFSAIKETPFKPVGTDDIL